MYVKTLDFLIPLKNLVEFLYNDKTQEYDKNECWFAGKSEFKSLYVC